MERAKLDADESAQIRGWLYGHVSQLVSQSVSWLAVSQLARQADDQMKLFTSTAMLLQRCALWQQPWQLQA